MSRSQNDKLLAALGRGPMTALDIYRELGIMRASARVYDLRAAGFDVRSRNVAVRNRDGESCHVAEYSLAQGGQLAMFSQHPGRGRLTESLPSPAVPAMVDARRPADQREMWS